METELGVPWDVSFDTDLQTDTIFVDLGEATLTLSMSDLTEMLEVLGGV
jgi:hypothetical protein